jgi:hypothetical protein
VVDWLVGVGVESLEEAEWVTEVAMWKKAVMD